MNQDDAYRLRALFQSELSSQNDSVREFLDKIFADVAFDQQDFQELWAMWQRFEGWIACHGLDAVAVPKMRYG